MINCIVAVEKNCGIGYKEYMPWPRLPGDMSWFQKITSGNIVIMGSVTWRSLGRPLPNRINVVLSKTRACNSDHVFSDLDTAIEFCQQEYPDKEIFIIGGDSIYKQAMPIIGKFYITEIQSEFICDRFFNVNYVKDNFTNAKEIARYNEPVPYVITEYNRT